MDIVGKLQELAAIVESAKADAEVFAKAKYDEGFAAGVAASGGDKIYSQAELDAALSTKAAEVKAAIKAKYDEAQAAETALEASVFAE